MVRKKGFTLIELLVVIAIIAILAAILFPVFAKAREKARQSSCASNFKQVGIAMMQYVQDYEGTFPPFASYEQLDPYLKNAPVWQCPSGPKSLPWTIGWNVQAFRPDEAEPYFYVGVASESTIVHPSETICWLDTTGEPYWAVGTPFQFFYCPSTLAAPENLYMDSIACRHSDGANAGFADGHTKWMKNTNIIAHGGNGTGPWGWWVGYKGGADNWFDRD